jgi:ATP-dependent Clp protease ATP-binding subunit ClpA
MFERFTDGARKSLLVARASASSRAARSIEPEDVLHGILVAVPSAVARLGDGAEASEPAAFGETADGHVTAVPEATVSEAEEAIRRHDSLGIPFSRETGRALISAAVEADALGHRSICAEHLVLGLLGDEGTQAARTLDQAGVRLQQGRRILREKPNTPVQVTTERTATRTPWLRPLAGGGIAVLCGAAVLVSIPRVWRWFRKAGRE